MIVLADGANYTQGFDPTRGHQTIVKNVEMTAFAYEAKGGTFESCRAHLGADLSDKLQSSIPVPRAESCHGLKS